MKIQCEKCGREYEIEENFIGQKVQCECGYKWQIENQIASNRKNRFLYVFLGLFFGQLGAHNFYAAQYPAAISKIFIEILTIITFFFEREAWILPAFINVYFIIWDLCYDPNIPTGERKRILHLPPWIFSTIILMIFLIVAISFLVISFFSMEIKAK